MGRGMGRRMQSATGMGAQRMATMGGQKKISNSVTSSQPMLDSPVEEQGLEQLKNQVDVLRRQIKSIESSIKAERKAENPRFFDHDNMR